MKRYTGCSITKQHQGVTMNVYSKLWKDTLYAYLLILEEDPFKSYIAVGTKIKDQKSRVREGALDNARGSAGVWMYMVSKAGSGTHKPKGLTAVFHHSNVTLLSAPKATDPSFKMDSKPYDIVELFNRQGGKWIGMLISDCTSSAPYVMNSVTAMYSMLVIVLAC
jgi:hypothetical protein